ncbi:hypothetical protein QJQ45_018600, partial [Haematococcus lacustris]
MGLLGCFGPDAESEAAVQRCRALEREVLQQDKDLAGLRQQLDATVARCKELQVEASKQTDVQHRAELTAELTQALQHTNSQSARLLQLTSELEELTVKAEQTRADHPVANLQHQVRTLEERLASQQLKAAQAATNSRGEIISLQQQLDQAKAALATETSYKTLLLQQLSEATQAAQHQQSAAEAQAAQLLSENKRLSSEVAQLLADNTQLASQVAALTPPANGSHGHDVTAAANGGVLPHEQHMGVATSNGGNQAAAVQTSEEFMGATQAALLTQQLNEASKQSKALQAELVAVQAAQEGLQQELQRAQLEKASVQQAYEAAYDEGQAATAFVLRLQAELAEAQAEVQRLRQDKAVLLVLESRLGTEQAAHSASREHCRRLEDRIASLTADAAAHQLLATSHEQLQQQCAGLQQRCQELEGQAEQVHSQLQALQHAHSLTLQEMDQLRSTLQSHLLMNETTASQTTALLSEYQQLKGSVATESGHKALLLQQLAEATQAAQHQQSAAEAQAAQLLFENKRLSSEDKHSALSNEMKMRDEMLELLQTQLAEVADLDLEGLLESAAGPGPAALVPLAAAAARTGKASGTASNTGVAKLAAHAALNRALETAPGSSRCPPHPMSSLLRQLPCLPCVMSSARLQAVSGAGRRALTTGDASCERCKVPEDSDSGILDRDEALQPDLTEAERNRSPPINPLGLQQETPALSSALLTSPGLQMETPALSSALLTSPGLQQQHQQPPAFPRLQQQQQQQPPALSSALLTSPRLQQQQQQPPALSSALLTSPRLQQQQQQPPALSSALLTSPRLQQQQQQHPSLSSALLISPGLQQETPALSSALLTSPELQMETPALPSALLTSPGLQQQHQQPPALPSALLTSPRLQQQQQQPPALPSALLTSPRLQQQPPALPSALLTSPRLQQQQQPPALPSALLTSPRLQQQQQQQQPPALPSALLTSPRLQQQQQQPPALPSALLTSPGLQQQPSLPLHTGLHSGLTTIQ